MNFSSFYSLLQERNYSYNIPSDQELLMYDFYMMTHMEALNKEGKFEPGQKYDKFGREEESKTLSVGLRDSTRFSFEEIKEKILTHLKPELLEASFYAVACEMTHLPDYISTWYDDKRLESKIGNRGIKILSAFLYINERNNALYSKKTTDPYAARRIKKDARLNPKISYDQEKNSRSNKYYQAYNSALKTVKKLKITPVEFVYYSKIAFETARWHGSYGGQNWANIADAYLKLHSAKTDTDKIIFIDNMYHQQHNTGSMFNKLSKYLKSGGYQWLQRALDFKADVKNSWQRITKIKEVIGKNMALTSGIPLRPIDKMFVEMLKASGEESWEAYYNVTPPPKKEQGSTKNDIDYISNTKSYGKFEIGETGSKKSKFSESDSLDKFLEIIETPTYDDDGDAEYAEMDEIRELFSDFLQVKLNQYKNNTAMVPIGNIDGATYATNLKEFLDILTPEHDAYINQFGETTNLKDVHSVNKMYMVYMNRTSIQNYIKKYSKKQDTTTKNSEFKSSDYVSMQTFFAENSNDSEEELLPKFAKYLLDKVEEFSTVGSVNGEDVMLIGLGGLSKYGNPTKLLRKIYADLHGTSINKIPLELNAKLSVYSQNDDGSISKHAGFGGNDTVNYYITYTAHKTLTEYLQKVKGNTKDGDKSTPSSDFAFEPYIKSYDENTDFKDPKILKKFASDILDVATKNGVEEINGKLLYKLGTGYLSPTGHNHPGIILSHIPGVGDFSLYAIGGGKISPSMMGTSPDSVYAIHQNTYDAIKKYVEGDTKKSDDAGEPVTVLDDFDLVDLCKIYVDDSNEEFKKAFNERLKTSFKHPIQYGDMVLYYLGKGGTYNYIDIQSALSSVYSIFAILYREDSDNPGAYTSTVVANIKDENIYISKEMLGNMGITVPNTGTNNSQEGESQNLGYIVDIYTKNSNSIGYVKTEFEKYIYKKLQERPPIKHDGNNLYYIGTGGGGDIAPSDVIKAIYGNKYYDVIRSYSNESDTFGTTLGIDPYKEYFIYEPSLVSMGFELPNNEFNDLLDNQSKNDKQLINTAIQETTMNIFNFAIFNDIVSKKLLSLNTVNNVSGENMILSISGGKASFDGLKNLTSDSIKTTSDFYKIPVQELKTVVYINSFPVIYSGASTAGFIFNNLTKNSELIHGTLKIGSWQFAHSNSVITIIVGCDISKFNNKFDTNISIDDLQDKYNMI